MKACIHKLLIMLLFTGMGFCLNSLAGCGPQPSATIEPTPYDRQISQEVLEMVREKLSKLPAEHPIIQRYGEFESLGQPTVTKKRAGRVINQPYPAKLSLRCRAVFSKGITPFHIGIVNGPNTQLKLNIDPSHEYVMEHEAELRPVFKQDGLHYESGVPGQNGFMDRFCTIGCGVTIPDYEP